MSLPKPVIVSVFSDLQTIINLDLAQWDLLIRQAKRANLTARLAYLLSARDLLDYVPAQPLNHLKSAMIYAGHFERSLSREIQYLLSAFKDKSIPLILLKGSGYFVAGNASSMGRIFSDIDLLVDEKIIDEAEFALMVGGWMPDKMDAYDQKYYRSWMHEVPPLTHFARRKTIDLHHNILPKTCHACPDASKLLANRIKIKNQNVWVLAPEDRLIHSAVHLFHEGELGNGFRDISDIDLLLRDFSKQPGFWQILEERVVELHLEIPLFYALRYANKLLKTPLPDEIIHSKPLNKLGKLELCVMDWLFLRALLPDHPSCNDTWTGLARWLLYIRSHYLKMPWYLLLPHLARKAWMRLAGKDPH